jgi:glycosyltransferase involved in cell wall biosynthesis
VKLSIIVTCFNIEQYIAQCLESICNQTLSDIEIIVVDDASTDGTQDIINQFASVDTRIKTVFFEENTIGGVSSAANAGLELAQGEYIGFADGDDWYEPEMFERLVSLSDRHQVDVSFCNYLEFDESEKQNVIPSDAKKWPDIIAYADKPVSDETFRKLFLRMNPVPWRKVYRREFIVGNAISFPVGDYFFEDNPFHWETTLKATSFAFEDFVGCYHRIARAGQTMSSADQRLFAMYEHHDTIYNMINDMGRYEEFYVQNVGWLIGNTEWISRKLKPELLPELMLIFNRSLEMHGISTIDKALSQLPTGVRGRELAHAALSKKQERVC